jgi:hypothetical protein
MDTQTILNIIAILDNRIDMHPYADKGMTDGEWIIAFRDHLQNYIEQKLGSAELITGE